MLAGFRHVLKEDGLAKIDVPDVAELMRVVVDGGPDVECAQHDSTMGAVAVLDVLYG